MPPLEEPSDADEPAADEVEEDAADGAAAGDQPDYEERIEELEVDGDEAGEGEWEYQS